MTFTVIIAEKPSVARDIAAFLASRQGGKYASEEGAYVLPNGDKVTYTVGHILELEMPDAYLTKEQSYADQLTYLPLLPPAYKYHPRYKRNKDGSIAMRGEEPVIDPLFRTVEKLLKKADVIINAGDVGREGQLIMDELFIYVGLDPDSPHIKRVDTSDNSREGLEKAWAKMDQNSNPRWRNCGLAGLARAEADWDIGMNASRAYHSLTGDKTLGLGRVKTVVLSIVSERCEQIENFKPVEYYVPIITMKDGLEMRWHARKGAEGMPGFDQEGRIISRELAESIVAKINAGLQGTILRAQATDKSIKPPLGFSLAKLQSEGSKRLGVTVKEVTEAAQSLYERHKLITYVGVECEYYPESMLAEARSLMEGLSPMYAKLMAGANASMHPKSFNDAKLDEHYAISPKGKLPDGQLTPVERGVFDMVVRRFAAQFYPNYEYRAFVLEADFADDQFIARDKETLREGWREAEGLVESEEENEELTQTAEKDAERDAFRYGPQA
jgi:DNA topoisomerase-3